MLLSYEKQGISNSDKDLDTTNSEDQHMAILSQLKTLHKTHFLEVQFNIIFPTLIHYSKDTSTKFLLFTIKNILCNKLVPFQRTETLTI
jgi:hypothetical protein